jgi:predicted helicase
MTDDSRVLEYVEALKEKYASGHAREHAYRPALERLMDSFENVTAVNDPKRSQHGNPDFVFVKRSNRDITFGYAEAKDIDVSLAKTLKTDQLRRYAGYEKLFLTNYLDFKFFRNGEQYEEVSIGKLANKQLVFNTKEFARLQDVLQEFLNQPPETIKSGKKLALIMGGKARRIRDNVQIYLKHTDNEKNAELEKIFKMMKELLVHDLTADKFADMYAQTLVYGLFAARYNDKTPEHFDRKEARDLVPKSNPFLRHFFDHIVGPDFDTRLSYIVDELCEAFSVSNVHLLVQKHLRLFEVENEKDPIIHFYEDFLKEYDPAERKRMGAYYTPIPVVRFIIKQVDEILKREFDLPKGLADTAKIEHVVTDSGGKKHKHMTHKVQVLDPAVGTATFLNEIIKYVYKGFEGQEGRWPTYAEEDLLPRLHGFELMMAPYTIAHLKLGMTLQETGVKDFNQRLGVYLTNTLEEGIQRQQNLFSFGLANVVSEEASEAAKIKHERPIMVVMGNPPYSVSSNNKSEYIQNLIKDYKKDLNEKKTNLDDDYIKFIRFAEDMVIKNGEGIVGMITNNSFVDGITHRQMRKHLLETFDKIYILNLHGNSKKKETAPDGTKDENVFDIQQGVSISLFVKKTKKVSLGEVSYIDLFGHRTDKFKELNENHQKWTRLEPVQPNFFFVPKNFSEEKNYKDFVGVADLLMVHNSGVKTDRDELFIDIEKSILKERMEKLISQDYDSSFIDRYKVKDSGSYKLTQRIKGKEFSSQWIAREAYRPFDDRYIYYDASIISRPASKITQHILNRQNLVLSTSRTLSPNLSFNQVFITSIITDVHTIGDQNYSFPLYLYHLDGSKTPNFNELALKQFTSNLEKPYEPEDVFDYIYAILHSPNYRKKYGDLLKIDFPRVPVPKNDEQFHKFAGYGKQLRELHLMTSSSLGKLITTFPTEGTNEVERIKYDGGKVWINDKQYFGDVPEVAWNFYIGGYQPAQKWLKDRKDRKLSSADIEHYQKIIKILAETDKVMQKIDEAISP